MSNWNEKYLTDFSTLSYGDNMPGSELKQSGYSVFGANGYVGFSDRYNIDTKTVLISCRGENSGVINIVPEKTFVTNNSIPVKLKNDDIDVVFLFYLLQTISKGKIVSGSAQPQVTINDLKRVSLKFPSLKSQQKIAKILATTETVIEKTQAAIAKYKAIKQGMLNDLFTRGIDIKTGKLRPKQEDAPGLYKESELGWIPKEWDIKIFGKEVDLIHGHQFRDYDFSETGIPIAKIGQVKPENLDLSNCSYVKLGREVEFKNEIIRNGDVLMALTGATLGKACLVSDLNGIVLQNYRVGRFEPIIVENDIDKIFLYYLLIAGELLQQIFSKVNSGAQGNVGKADFEKATFKKPPFSEQKIIAEKLNSIDKKLKTEHNYLQKLQQLKSGLMADLLSGNKLVSIPKEMETQTT